LAIRLAETLEQAHAEDDAPICDRCKNPMDVNGWRRGDDCSLWPHALCVVCFDELLVARADAAAQRERAERAERLVADQQTRLDLLAEMNGDGEQEKIRLRGWLATVRAALHLLVSQAKAEAGAYELIPSHRVHDWIRKAEPALTPPEPRRE